MRKSSTTMNRICFVLFLALTFLFAVPVSAQDVILVIDPGHGGIEAGAARNGYREEIINQKIADYLKQELETYADIQVYMTRTSVNDPAQNREVRVNIAKKKKADALVSLHINSSQHNAQTSLTGAYAVVPSTKYKSIAAVNARKLGTAILNGLQAKAGTKNNGYWIDDELGIILFGQKNDYTSANASKLGISKTLLNTQVPSLIVEHCFINNANDRSKYLSTNAKLKKLALGDAAGIANFFHLHKKTESIVLLPKKTGLVKEQDGWHLYDSEGKAKHGLCKYKTKYYYCDYQGKCASKWMWIGNRHYYFGNTTSAGLNGFYKIGKYYYWFKDGYCRSKWVTIDGKKYYFSKVNGHLLTNYWLNWEGHWYYLNSKGNPWISCTKLINGKKYKFNSLGYCTNK